MIIKLYLPGRMRLSLGKNNNKGTTGNEIHYIGGSEVLPPPLEGEEENRAINGLETEYASEARALLIEHNLRLVVYIAKNKGMISPALLISARLKSTVQLSRFIIAVSSL